LLKFWWENKGHGAAWSAVVSRPVPDRHKAFSAFYRYSRHMRTRTIITALLAVYAIFSTVYFAIHFVGGAGGVGGNAHTASSGLPMAPPLPEDAPAPATGADLLARVEIENELRYTDLQSFVCNEHMDRFRGRLNGEDPKHIDTVTAQVSFENGVENYSSIQQNNRLRASMAEISGAWSEGEFGTLLRQTRTLLSIRPAATQAAKSETGEPAVLYSLSVPGQESPWELIVDNKKFRVPFVTEVLVSQANGRILRIKRTSTAMPESFGISQIEWSVNLKPVLMDGNEWLLPAAGEYAILYAKNNRREWNEITFAGYHRYAATSVMHF
jgi:hypothetical protein